MYHRANIKAIKIIVSIVIATTRKIFVVINQMTITIINGKLKNMMKLNITRRFSINIRKYNLIVLHKFSIVILLDIHTDLNTFLLSNTIIYLEYVNNIFKIIHRKSIMRNM
jgi:hypothetical protein